MSALARIGSGFPFSFMMQAEIQELPPFLRFALGVALLGSAPARHAGTRASPAWS